MLVGFSHHKCYEHPAALEHTYLEHVLWNHLPHPLCVVLDEHITYETHMLLTLILVVSRPVRHNNRLTLKMCFWKMFFNQVAIGYWLAQQRSAVAN